MHSQSFSSNCTWPKCAVFDVSSKKRLPQAILIRRNVRGEDFRCLQLTDGKTLTFQHLPSESNRRNVCGNQRAFLRRTFLGISDIPRHSTPIPRHSTPLSPDEKKVRIQSRCGFARKKTAIWNTLLFQYRFFVGMDVVVVFGGGRG